MIINHNIAALNTYRQLSSVNTAASKSLEKLSSGLRINRAGDDAAGLAISEKMRGQIRGLNMASKNAQDGISLLQTAEGALNETHSILQRMRELAVQASSDSATASDRQQIQKEVDQLAKELSRIANTTEFNTKNLLAGGFKNQVFQIGANEGQSISVSFGAFDAYTLGLTAHQGVSVAQSGAVQGGTLSSNATIKTGTYKIGGTVTTAATAATVQGSDIDLSSGLTLSSDATLTISLNGGTGVNITISSGTYDTPDALVAAIQQKIDATSLKGEVVVSIDSSTLSNSKLIFTTVDKGSNVSISVTGDASSTLGFGSTATTGTGTNAAVDLTLYSEDGTAIETKSVTSTNLANAVAFTNGLNVTLDTTSINALDVDTSLPTALLDVVAAESTAATTSSDGQIIEEATVEKGILVNTQDNASKAITAIDNAINIVSTARSQMGAYQNRLEHTINNLGTASENLSAAESRIRDVDYAEAA
ncbi:flagellin N-terminal helical domain-containing protein [Desulfofundulus thermocisternus]|uniref:flagellin N-terminal helical domain-containing protein n=1 Tax=Desulfofundulus thermocisternus TaxID=42471 RepID=UPI000483B142|nr:flagellin [Desulfofundulus thermocisternus]